MMLPIPFDSGTDIDGLTFYLRDHPRVKKLVEVAWIPSFIGLIVGLNIGDKLKLDLMESIGSGVALLILLLVGVHRYRRTPEPEGSPQLQAHVNQLSQEVGELRAKIHEDETHKAQIASGLGDLIRSGQSIFSRFAQPEPPDIEQQASDWYNRAVLFVRQNFNAGQSAKFENPLGLLNYTLNVPHNPKHDPLIDGMGKRIYLLQEFSSQIK